jgi:hypothetical protein
MEMNPLVRTAALGVVLACVVMGTAACGPTPTPIATPDIPISDTDSDTDDTDDGGIVLASGEQPEPAADVSCNDLTNPAQLDPIFAVTVNLAPPTRTYEYVGAQIAEEWIVRQAGGVACQWSDPDGISTSEGRYLSGMDLRLLPASGPQWQEFSDAQGDGSDSRFSCDDYGNCNYDVYTATGWWLSLAAFNIDSLASPSESALRSLTSPVFSAIAATVNALPAPDPTWSAPTADFTFGGGCTGVTTGDRLSTALGLGTTVDFEFLGFPRVGLAASDSVGGSDCRWARGSDGWDIAYIQVLPGGAWAQAAAKAAMEANGGSVPTPAVPGVPAGATAYYQHVDSESLDIVLGGTWIKISMGNGSLTGGLSPQAALIAIGADIAAHAH